MMKYFFTAVVSCLLILAGCETLDEMMKDDGSSPFGDAAKKPEFVISVHEIVEYPRGSQLEREIPTFSGSTIWINTNPFLHSRDIEEVKLLEMKDKKDFYDLALKLSRRGKIMWIALAEQARVKKFGLLVDGVFYRMFKPERSVSDEESWVKLNGPFDKITASSIVEFSKSNYTHFTAGKDINSLY